MPSRFSVMLVPVFYPLPGDAGARILPSPLWGEGRVRGNYASIHSFAATPLTRNVRLSLAGSVTFRTFHAGR
ncbi:hypothetical protein DFO53_1891 [Enterobacter sp. AG5470]|nr:hypothetical protein DFO53_1891 [Enterobacter sp. AG5470]